MSNRTAEIDAAYAAATPGLGAGHALEAKLIGPAAYAARLSAARDAVNDAGLDAEIDKFAVLGNALAIHDVEFDLLEGRSHLVLDHLDAGLVAGDFLAVLDGTDAADVETD